MEFSLSAREHDRETLVSVAGELDVATAGELWNCLAASLRAGHNRLLLDLARVTFMDCAALGVLVRARDASLVRGGELRLVAAHRRVRLLLALTGTQSLVECGALCSVEPSG